MPKKTELTPAAIQEYLDSHSATRENFVDSISKLRKRNRRAEGPGEVAENDAKILDLTADKALLDSKKAAFEADRHTITPPTPEQLDTLEDLVTKVEELNVKTEIINQVLQLSAQALTTFNEIHPNQD